MNARFDVKDLWEYVKTWNISYHVIFLLFIFILPIFVGYDNGKLTWDSSYRSTWTVIPIGLIAALVLLLVTLFNNLRNNYKYLLIVFCSTLISYLLSSDVRTLIVGTQIILLISTVEALDWLFKRNEVNWKQIQEYLFFIVLFVVVVKFYTDVYYYFSYYLYTLPGSHPGWSGYPKHILGSLGALYQNAFCQPVFINKEIYIYNYFEYFQLIYILGVFLVLRNFNKYPLLAAILLCLIFFYLYYSTAKVWKVTLFIFPVLYLGSKIKLNFQQVFLLFALGWVFIIGLAGYLYDRIDLGLSLNLRMSLIYELFANMDWKTFLFPKLNYDVSATGRSMHNEFLEVWYRCGIAAALTFWWWGYVKLTEVFKNDRLLSILLLFILMFGGIIQLNYLHLYTMLMLAGFIAASRVDVNRNEIKVQIN